MRRLALLALGVSLLAVVLVLRRGERGSSLAEATGPAAAPGASRAAALAAPEVAERGALEAPRTNASAALESALPARAEPGVVVGHVLHRADRRPIAGASVRAGIEPDGGGFDTLHGPTEADGSFRLACEQPATLIWVQALPTATTAGSGRVSWRGRVAPGRSVEVELLVGSGGSVSGRVVDGEGQAVPGALVQLWNDPGFKLERSSTAQEVLAALDGSFEVTHAGPEFLLEAHTDTLTCVLGVSGEVADGGRIEGVVLEVGEPWTIEARVVDDAGRGIAGVLATGGRSFPEEATSVAACSRYVPEPAQATSDAQGRLVVGPLPSRVVTLEHGTDTFRVHEPVGLRVTCEGYLPTEVSVAPDQEQPVVIRLSSGTCLEGTVVDETDEPPSRAQVEVWVLGESSGRTTTDQGGRFRICGLSPTTEGILKVHAPGFAIYIEQPLAIGESSTDHLVRLEPGLPLAGRVVDAQDRAVADAGVTVIGDRRISTPGFEFGVVTTWEWAVGLDRTRTDTQGHFAFADLYAGTFVVRAVSPDDPELSRDVRAAAGSVDLVLRLDPAVAQRVVLVGTVTDALTEAPVPSFEVVAQDVRNESSPVLRFEGGRFRLAGLEEGEKELSIRAIGYARHVVPARHYAAGEHVLEVRLLAARSVELCVIDAEGTPAPPGTQVGFQDREGHELGLEQGVLGWGPWAVLDEDGRLRASGLPADVVRVAVSLGVDGEVSLFDVDLRQELLEPIVLRLDRSLPPEPPGAEGIEVDPH